MTDISIITFTLGNRSRYLFQCLDSVYSNIDHYGDTLSVEHHLVFQGYTKGTGEILTELHDVMRCLETYRSSDYYKLIVHEWPANIGIGAGLNKILPECNGDLIFKMDDDCRVVSDRFFEYALILHNKFPNDVFSPFPVGLIGNPAGPRGHKHSVWWDKKNHIIFTRRHTGHVGGFARFSPKSLMEKFQFSPDLVKGISGTEDGQLSQYCNANGITMFYLEDHMIVSHQDSTLGQVVRYPEYFRERSGEQGMKFEVVE